MEYEYQLSQRSRDILALLAQPTKKQIYNERSDFLPSEVGTPFENISRNLHLSIHQIRKQLQEELYGPVGVFIIRFKGFYQDSNGETTAYFTDGTPVKGRAKKHTRQKGLYIPEQTQDAVEKSLDDEEGLFSGDINEESLPILEFVLNKSLELRRKHGNKWYPYFSDRSISRDIGVELKQAKIATTDLTGILCEAYQIKSRSVWGKRFFLPSSKFGLAKRLCSS